MKSIFLTLSILLCSGLMAQSVTISDIDLEEVSSTAFSLSQDEVVSIEGAGAALEDDWKIAVYYAWIINSDTREIEWHLFDFMDDNEIEVDGDFEFAAKKKFKKGNYEVYYAAGRTNYSRYNGRQVWNIDSFNDVVNNIFNSRSSRRYRHSVADDMFIKVSSSSLKRVDIGDLRDDFLENAIVSFNRVGDRDSFEKGFSLKDDTELKIYAIGEGEKDESFDYFWIYDAATREPVFTMNYRNADYAGGAKKNMVVEETIQLKKGDYLARFISDDSHSYEEWNALPPDDPYFWGATLWPASSADAKNIIPYREPKTASPLVNLTRVRDDELVSQGFKIKSTMDVRILCLGEGSDHLVDYGWIIDANTREKVWKMKQYKTDHAGGAKKNRRTSEVITLDKGDYIAYYSTDDSHSYNDWNSSPPQEEDLWGLSVWATEETDLNKIALFEPENFKRENSLLEILMVRDDEYIRETFTLDSETRIRIMAMGEGSDGDMYDYAYIKDEDGRRVWEMEYHDTDHAGGARKNREINERVTLEKGTYRVTYKSDGSHSYNRWNASPPSDEEMWGVIILKE